ncbi:thioredoxin domain-containing protein [Pseudactinotalea sp. HY160]|uniref:DsbA family protein n=1 Tax=Pseudactinotalea sp. HY160 TaxID=2654490 RepID=UPI00128BEC5C|nr:thioredoxin domain-containing protein [Pseudactinotalea sp. HY160]MPV48455.1 thioredoxin domain-containing protein [Pseudactinotalea sp. HY160]
MSANTKRREDARKQAEKIAAKQASSDNRTRNILIIIIAAVIALLVVAGIVIYQASQKTLLSDFEGTAPAAADTHGGIAFSDQGVGVVGSGPVVQVYVDFMCPICGDFEEVNGADLVELVEAGTATVVYHPVNFLDRYSQGTAYSTRAANAFVTVAEDAPDQALDFMTAMFEQQPAENTTGLTDEEIAGIAVDAGVPQEVADTFGDLTYGDWVDAASQQATRDGVTGTPSVVINGTPLDTKKYNWTQPGVLRDHIEELAG